MLVDDEIKALEDEIRNTQYNKATQHHIGLLKAKIAHLRQKKESGSGSGKGAGYAVRKTGDASVVLVGFPSVGKSTILNALTNAESKTAAYAFTTLSVIPGVMDYKGAKVQILDVPGLIEGASSGSGRGRKVISVVRNADLIVMVLEPFSLQQLGILEGELENANVRINQQPPKVVIKRKERGGLEIASTVKLTKVDRALVREVMAEFRLLNAAVVIRQDISVEQLIDAIEGNRVYIPALAVVNKCDTASDEQLREIKKALPHAILISAEEGTNLQLLRDSIFNKLDLMRVYMKEAGKPADMEHPLIVRRGSKIEDVCARLHSSFSRRLRFARVWGNSAKFAGQVLRGKHELRDADVVELHLR